VLPETTAEQAGVVLERLRAKISAIETAANAPLTISFGLIEHPAHGSATRELMHAADVALYRAKALGRDQVVVGQPALALTPA
jgi:two-component system cell cycle response regulator